MSSPVCDRTKVRPAERSPSEIVTSIEPGSMSAALLTR